jgi:flagellar FliJ protein
MSNVQRFELLLKVAEVREQDAARTLADNRMALQKSKGKLQELLGYRADYAKDMSNSGGLNYGVQLQDYRLFLDRLNRAISMQREQINQDGATVEASKQKWQDAHKQLAILNKVTDRTRIADRAAADKRDQKWIDELAGAAHARTRKRS